MLDKEYSFDVDVYSDVLGKQCKGHFVIRRPSLQDMSAISTNLSRLNQGEPFVSRQYEVMFTTIATIAVCGEQTPSWWTDVADENLDANVVIHVGARLVEARNKRLPFRSGEPETEAPSP